MVKITIDDKVVEVEEGLTILDAAMLAGINIPTICSHESLSPAGSCRLCTVEIKTNGRFNLAAACNYPVEAGLEVKTDSEKVLEARRLTVELLLAQRPQSDKIQKLAQKLGIEAPRFTLKERECILCDLCVRACHEIVGADAITFIAKGKDRNIDEAVVVHSLEKCIGCDSCAFICPTEAIKVEDIGDTRIISTPSGKLEFKLKQCKTCGKYWAPEKQLEYIIKKQNLEPEIFDTCPDCRD
ncbi:2Fe-2S iron-sulfur cluster-binding protein [Chloroflexota bacterium]